MHTCNQLSSCNIAPCYLIALCWQRDLLVPTGADGVDVFEPEVELEVGVDEGGNEASRGCINVQPDVPSILLVQLLCNNKTDAVLVAYKSYIGYIYTYININV